MWLKGRLNKAGQFPDDEIRSVGDQLVSFTANFSITLCLFSYNNLFPIFCVQKETEDKIKDGTLQVDQGTDAMTVVLGKEKGGYARGVGSGVTYNRYFDLPRNRQTSDERVASIQCQLDNERRERQEKEVVIKNLSDQVAETQGMVAQLMSQLAAQGEKLQSLSTQMPASQARHLL